MKFSKPSGKGLVLVALIIVTASCDFLITKPRPTPNPTATNLLPLSSEPTFATIMTETREIESVTTQTAIPTLFGTPLPNYKTIPIPGDAVAGIETEHRYEFTSKQAPIEVSSYYQQVLPQVGWEIQQVSTLDGDAENPTNICLALSQTSGSFHAVVCILRKPGEELTSVRLTVYITD